MPFRVGSHSVAKAGYRSAREVAVSICSVAGIGLCNAMVVLDATAVA
jgi:hypothetical protein